MAENPPDDPKWTPQGQPQQLDSHSVVGSPLAWCNAAIGACCLIFVIAGVQIFRANFEGSLYNESAQTCHLRTGSGEHITGRITGFLQPQDALNMIEYSQAHANGTISPDYITQRRARVEVPFQ